MFLVGERWIDGAPHFGAMPSPLVGGPPTRIVTVVAFALHPRHQPLVVGVSGLKPTGFREGHIEIGGLPINGLLPLYRSFFLVGGAEPLPTIR